MSAIHLNILSPEGPLVQTDVDRVTLPGAAGSFTVLKDHAPLVTALTKGRIRYVSGGKESFLTIREGFVQVGDNRVDVCVEL